MAVWKKRLSAKTDLQKNASAAPSQEVAAAGSNGCAGGSAPNAHNSTSSPSKHDHLDHLDHLDSSMAHPRPHLDRATSAPADAKSNPTATLPEEEATRIGRYAMQFPLEGRHMYKIIDGVTKAAPTLMTGRLSAPRKLLLKILTHETYETRYFLSAEGPLKNYIMLLEGWMQQRVVRDRDAYGFPAGMSNADIAKSMVSIIKTHVHSLDDGKTPNSEWIAIKIRTVGFKGAPLKNGGVTVFNNADNIGFMPMSFYDVKEGSEVVAVLVVDGMWMNRDGGVIRYGLSVRCTAMWVFGVTPLTYSRTGRSVVDSLPESEAAYFRGLLPQNLQTIHPDA